MIRSFDRIRCVLLLTITVSTVAATVARCAGLPPTIDDRSSDERFLAGLRERQLFDLAENYCRRKLARNDLSDRQRARMTIELARVLAGRALDAPRAERAKLWQQAFELLTAYRTKFPESGFTLLVEYRRAAIQLEQAEVLRQEARLAGSGADTLNSVRQRLRETIKTLRSLDEAIVRAARSPTIERDAARGLTKSQLTALGHNTKFQLGRAYRIQAETYAAGSPDRVNAIGQADELLGPLAEINTDATYVWNSRVELMRTARLAGTFEKGEAIARMLRVTNPAQHIQQAMQAELVRILAAQPSTIRQALDVVANDRKAGRVQSGDLALAQLEAQLAAWRVAKQASDTSLAAKHLEDASDTLAAIRAEYPGYWALRAGQLLDTTDQSAILVRSAATHYHEGRFDEAVAAYASAAQRASDAERKFELSLIAAKIEHGRERWSDAIRRYRRLALAWPKHDAASETHLTAIQLAAAKLSKDGDLYAQLLAEHVATWPEQPSAGESFVRLGELAEIEKQWIRAIAAYMKVPRGNQRQLAAIRGVSRCVAPLIAAAQAKNQRTDKLASDAASYFESVVRTADGNWPERFNRVAQEASLAAARIRLQHVARSELYVEQLLAAALARAVEPTPAWQQEAHMLSVVALAMQGKAADARKRIAAVTSGSADQLLALAGEIQRAATTSDGAQAKAMAGLQLDVVRLLKSQNANLSPQQRTMVMRREAEALSGIGRRDEALRLFASIAGGSPNDGALQEAYAELLLDSDDKPQIQAALERWRAIDKRSRPGTARWLRAKYALASAHLKLGNSAQAKKIIALTRVLAPDLGGAEMQAKFDALLEASR